MFRRLFNGQISLWAVITIIISLCMITPLIVTSAYSYNQLEDNAYTSIEYDLRTSAEKSFTSLDSSLLSIKNTYYTIISDPIINPSLYRNISDYSLGRLSSNEAIDDRLTKIMFFCTVWSEKVLSSVVLFDSIDSYHYIDNTKIGDYMDSASLNALQSVTNNWNTIMDSISQNERINMFFHSSDSSDSIYYIRDFYDYSTGDFKGLVSFQLNEKMIMASFDAFQKYNGSLCILYDSTGNIIASSSDSVQNCNIQSGVFNGIIIKEMMIDNKNYIVRTSSLSNFNLRASVIVPLAPIKQQLFNQLQNYVFIFSILIICVVLAAIFLSRIITKYIDILIKRMSAVRHGDYLQTIPIYGITEIDNLSTAFCDMSMQIKKLLDEIYANEILLKESELKALQAQMNPHFLFNTLLSIGWKARANGDMEAYEMVNALSSLLKANIYTRETKFITVYEEIKNVKYYLMIQQSRFGERLTYDIDIAPEIMESPILKLSIQPIVENAIVHGLEKKIGEGHILVEGCVLGDEIQIKVIDNGVGFNPEKLEQDISSHSSQNPTGHHIGILNTHLRLKYTYGEQYGLTVESNLGKGTTVTIRYPKKGSE